MIKKTYLIASFDKLKINYIAIPKTGSTSILYSLLIANKQTNRKSDNDADQWVHSENLVNYITPEQVKDNYKNFTVIRDPYDRAYSMYYDFIKRRKNLGVGGTNEFSKEFEKFRNNMTFENFLEMLLKYPDHERGSHFRTQSRYCILDNLELLKLENISNTLEFKLLYLNRSNYKNVTISTKEIDFVLEIYKDDFNLWNKAL